MEKEFNLSEKKDFLFKEKRWDSEGNCLEWVNCEVYHVKDVKEFIRLLKEKVEKWEGDSKTLEIIDKLAGKELVENGSR